MISSWSSWHISVTVFSNDYDDISGLTVFLFCPPQWPPLALSRQRFVSGDSVSPRRQHSSRASSGDGSFERPPSRSSRTRPSSLSREDKEADDSSIPAPVRAMIDFILRASLMPRLRLPIFRRDPSTSLPMQALQTLRFPRDRSWRGAMPCWMPSLTHTEIRSSHQGWEGLPYSVAYSQQVRESVHRLLWGNVVILDYALGLKIMKVFPSPCQEWGITVFSNDTTYWVPSLRMPHLSRCQWDMLQ